MADKFTKNDIEEIASKLQWKPSKLSYNILYVVMSLSILYILLVLYLIVQYNSLQCKFIEIYDNLESLQMTQSNFTNMTKNVQENLENYNNNVRYLVSRSERNSSNESLSKQPNLPIFANEKENSNLFSALRGD